MRDLDTAIRLLKRNGRNICETIQNGFNRTKFGALKLKCNLRNVRAWSQ